ncbi:M56 family metallopeptidase [Psychrobacillus lasiicapitis]|uniref:M56 family metallopeptidase n=1 Tax=Psychrobacillus lasiicapitis TaxID=1636719 RepID=A0A544TC50_9BACI|nr:M56 family metallopeptidase [Psychrobacillus lasiicapitis]TQR15040.1 M56 family metallopeptidase [Psychrobacillus lasiicapitis]GGA21972.1 cell surface protein [Psychrobacillus lasiicapitis]
MSKRQSSFLFLATLVISGTIFLQMVIYAISMLVGWNAKFNLVVVCHSWLKAVGLSSLEYALDGLVIFTLLFAIWHISSQLIHTARMKTRLEQYRAKKLTTEFNQTYSNEKEGLIIISHPTPMAITMGFAQPKIVISTGLINLLTNEELEAVIAHEMYHKENRDPLKIFILSLCASTIGYIPILKCFSHQYRIIQEILADEFAIKKQETTVHLGSALLKMLKVGTAKKMPFSYASFADTSVNYRIEYILNPLQIQMKIPGKVAWLSFVIFSMICGIFMYALA